MMELCLPIILVIDMKVESRELEILYGNASQFLTADNCAIGVESYGRQVVIKSTAISGYATLNDNAKSVLYPNSVAHPVKLDSRIACGASVNNQSNYCALEIDGIEVHKVLCSKEVEQLDGLTSDSILNSTMQSTLRYHLHIHSLLVAAACSRIVLRAYFKKFECSAVNVCDGVASSSVSSSEVWDGDSVTFYANIIDGSTWFGWYSDEKCENLVSTDMNYQTVPSGDLKLYAKAKLKVLYFKQNDQYIRASSVYVKESGNWVERNDIDKLFENRIPGNMSDYLFGGNFN